MASKTFVRTLRAASKQKVPSGSLQKRSFSSVLAARPAVPQPRAAFVPAQQTRGVKTIDFAGTKEVVYGKIDRPQRSFKANKCRTRGLAQREAPRTPPDSAYTGSLLTLRRNTSRMIHWL
jgi:hypothetical protein